MFGGCMRTTIACNAVIFIITVFIPARIACKPGSRYLFWIHGCALVPIFTQRPGDNAAAVDLVIDCHKGNLRLSLKLART